MPGNEEGRLRQTGDQGTMSTFSATDSTAAELASARPPTPEDWLTTPRPDGPWHISWVIYTHLRYQVERLTSELYSMTVDRDYWYLRANYTPTQIAEFRLRASIEGKRIDWERGVLR